METMMMEKLKTTWRGGGEGAVEAVDREIDRYVDGELVAAERVQPARGAGKGAAQ
jgi:hypothetical protein